tara:strand:+ start:282 stop:674 length:393 start_codon:yes stop_codon:yes gene_type:complete
MNIIGNGVDIIENSRIKKSIKKKDFLNRIFSKHEIDESKKIKNKVNFFAKRFAAKEAFAKSIGLGFRKNINFKDISVKNNSLGKPEIFIDKKVYFYIKKQFKLKKFKIFLSLADESKHSIAFVIIDKIRK